MFISDSPRFDEDHEREVYTWAGKRKNVTCISMGEPEPLLHWYRKDEVIDRDNETYKIYNLGNIKVLQVSYKLNSNILQVCYKLNSNILQVSYKLNSQVLLVSYKLNSNILQVSYKLNSKVLEVSYKLNSKVLQVSYKLNSNILQVSYKLAISKHNP